MIATGSNTAWPTKPEAPELWSRENIVKKFSDLHKTIKGSKSIVVVGGGATGSELAAELRHFNPDKTVTLVHNHEHLIGEGFQPKFYKKVSHQSAL